MNTCTGCGASEQPDGARFCFSCGAGLKPARCAACRAEMVAGARFCSSCGATQSAGALPAPPKPVASRRITSVLFGDLVGFTSLSESRDQEEVRELLSGYFEECSRIVARYGGTVEKFIGDAVMAVWGVPTTHEDDAERAVRAGLELVSRVESLGADLGVADLAMRVGIVTGEVAVTIGAEHQGMVAGDAVNTAARVQTAAVPGQVWVDETTRLLTTSAISYVDVGSHAMKGKVDPVPLWSVRAVVAAIGGAQRADGLEAPHVGRDRDLRLVKELFHGVEETHRPALLVVDGEPGVGKTRLGWEFEKYSDGLSAPVKWHSGRCLSYGEGVAFFALAEAIRGRLQLLDVAAAGDEDEADQAVLLEAGLDRYVPDLAERTWLGPRLGALMGIGAVGTFPREDLFSAWTTFLHRVSDDEYPVVLVIDDAQHADDGLLAFLEYLLGVGTFPCFVLLLSRTGLVEANPALATNRRSTVLHLGPLPARDMGALLDGLVHGLPETLRDSLVVRAEGIPLFAVETVRSLIDRDLVVPRGGQYVLADPDLDLDAIGAPASLQALISARLDTLPPAERRVLDQASVIGSSFPRDVIAALCPDVIDLDGALASLLRSQLLLRESNRFSAELGQFQFVQGAVRQVAYGTIARRDRKASHLAVARLLDDGEAATIEGASIVAQHYLEAIDAVPDAPDTEELAAAAVSHLQLAAARASALGAPAEAADHLGVALSRCTEPRQAALIEADLAEQLMRAGRHEAAIEHALQARDELDRLDDPVRAGAAVATLAACLVVGRSDFAQARALATERFDALESHEDAGTVQMRLVRAILSANLRSGEDMRDPAEVLGRLADRVGTRSDVAESYVSLGLHYMVKGPNSVGRLLLEEASTIGREAHDSAIMARALSNLNADLTQDDARRAEEIGREALAAARLTGELYWIDAAATNLMLAMLTHGTWDELMERIHDDVVDELGALFREMVRSVVAFACEEPWAPGEGLNTEFGVDDPIVQAIRLLLEAHLARAVGDPAAARLAVRCAEAQFVVSGLFDDFTVVWQAACDIAADAGDRTALSALGAIVEQDRVNKRPTGVRAQYSRLQAQMAILDGAEATVIEGHLRTALEEATAWCSRPTVARCRADLGVWLTHQGREGEAAPMLVEAREEFERLGALRWSRQLDAELAGVNA